MKEKRIPRKKIVRQLISGSLLALLLLPSAACRDKESKVSHIGILVGFPKFSKVADTFKKEMAAMGYVEGENVVYDQHEVTLDPVEERRIVGTFVEKGVDLVVAFPTSAALSAKSATRGTDIPVVFAFAGVEGNDLIESVSRPGGNLTGIRNPGPDLTVKRFELLHELVPDLKRLYITYNPDYAANRGPLKALRRATGSAGVVLVENPVTRVEDIRADLAARETQEDIGMDAIQMMTDDISQSREGWPMIAGFADRHRLPLSGTGVDTTHPACLFTYGPDIPQYGALAARLAAKVLQGTPAGSIAVISADPQLIMNRGRAEELGLTVPEGLLGLAAKIIP